MKSPALTPVLLTLFFCIGLAAQNITSTHDANPQIAFGAWAADFNSARLWDIGDDKFHRSPLELASGSISALDLEAPGKARKEYELGYKLLLRKDLSAAVTHLKAATAVYPKFVAAHSALGQAYLGLKENGLARDEFAQAAVLDDHLPATYMNLGCAELSLKDYGAAENSIKRASVLAPLDLHVLTALAYGELMNQKYSDAIATAELIHSRPHAGFAKVHLYAAAAWEAQKSIPQAQQELEAFLREDPKSAVATQVAVALQTMEDAPASAKAGPVPATTVTYGQDTSEPLAPRVPATFRKFAQNLKEGKDVAEVETDSACPNCGITASENAEKSIIAPATVPAVTGRTNSDVYTLRTSADEVAVLFAATDRGKSVIGLTPHDLIVRDDQKKPEAILGLRSESKLPLRLGIIIDTSASVTSRFQFEQEAAINFLENALTHDQDSAFVIGVANTVLQAQDFTRNQDQLSRVIRQLAPGGGTALWDAVAFGARKLSDLRTSTPVAKILVVISDGDDNSSSSTLKQALDQAQHGEVVIYSVSTEEAKEETAGQITIGTRALKDLAELTGGTVFRSDSITRIDKSFAALQEAIRSRYLLSYKPSAFRRDGRYRSITIVAHKDGHKLRVYARKGYFASVTSQTPQ